MGEEKKVEEADKKVEEEKKVEDAVKKEEEEEKEQEIVLKVDMHCEACARKVARSLKSFQGVESVTTDCKGSKVVVKGKDADPQKVCHRIQKKTGRKVELISPLPPKPSPEEPPPPPPPEPKKEEAPPAAVTVVLKVQMHCEACAQALQKRIKKLKGVESVATDLGKNEVVVKGIVDPDKLAADVYKKTGKQASVVKEEEKKEEAAEEKKEESVAEEDKKESSSSVEEHVHKLTAAELMMMKKSEQWAGQRYYMEYAHQHYPPPQIFSDENPHACNIM